MKITAPLLAAGVVALAGCAAPHKDMGMMSRAQCTTSPCMLTVKVTGTDCQRVTIKTTPNILDIPAGNRNDIEWSLDAPANWKFTNKGVEFKSGSGGGFTGGGGGGTTYRWRNNNSVKGEHRYNVNVTDGRAVCTEDPTIVNH